MEDVYNKLDQMEESLMSKLQETRSLLIDQMEESLMSKLQETQSLLIDQLKRINEKIDSRNGAKVEQIITSVPLQLSSNPQSLPLHFTDYYSSPTLQLSVNPQSLPLHFTAMEDVYNKMEQMEESLMSKFQETQSLLIDQLKQINEKIDSWNGAKVEQPIEKRFEDLSLSSSSFCPVMKETMETQFQRILSLPSEEATEKQQFQNIRFLISSRFLRCLHEVVDAIIRNAKGMHLMVRGPHILPTQVVNTTTRLTPSPKGFNLVRNFELQYHERVVDVLGSSELVEQIMSGVGRNHVDIHVEVVDLGCLRQ